MAATFDGTVRSIYLDGALLGSDFPGLGHTVDHANLALGRTASGEYFNGSLAEVSVWNAALDATTLAVARFRPVTPEHPYFTNLAGYWPMNEGADSLLTDDSGNGNTATLQTTPQWDDFTVGLSAGLTNLSFGTTYHFALQADAIIGGDASFSTLSAAAPLAVTFPASVQLQKGGGATLLQGLVAPHYLATEYYFQYGADTNYGSTTFPLSVGPALDGTNPVAVAISPIVIGQHYRLVASNAAGISFGYDLTVDSPPTQTYGADLPAQADGIVWADFDRDGRLDILCTGRDAGSNPVTLVLHNNGNGNFTDAGAGLPAVAGGSVAVADFDRDGWPDIALSVQDSSGTPVTQIWLNNQAGGFSLLTGTGLPALSNARLWAADFDHDGLTDLLLLGGSGKLAVLQVWRNQGDGTFQPTASGLPLLFGATAAVADLDLDGYPDLVLSGINPGTGALCDVWHNRGDGTFARVNASLPPLTGGRLAVADFDNDGFPDLLVTGLDANGLPTAEIRRNSGTGTFASVYAVLPGVTAGAVAIGDFNNDGRVDILLTGFGGKSGPVTQLLLNLGSGEFGPIAANFPSLAATAVAFGDDRNAGQLDLLLSGDQSGTPLFQFWQNHDTVANTPPTAPVGLSAAATGSGVTLHWGAGSDSQTPAVGLTYNVRLGTAPGSADVLPANAEAATGYRLVAAPGNAEQRRFLSLTNLTVGQTYYWSVQTVDGAYSGSAFAAEQSFTAGASGSVTINVFVTDGELVLAFSGRPGTPYRIQSVSALDGTWSTRGSATEIQLGQYEFRDPLPADASRFYRVVVP